MRRQPALGTTRGALELAESIHDGLRREVCEETGLDVEPITLTGVYKNLTRGIVALVFRCKVTGGHLTINDEVTAFRWVSQSDVSRWHAANDTGERSLRRSHELMPVPR